MFLRTFTRQSYPIPKRRRRFIRIPQILTKSLTSNLYPHESLSGTIGHKKSKHVDPIVLISTITIFGEDSTSEITILSSIVDTDFIFNLAPSSSLVPSHSLSFLKTSNLTISSTLTPSQSISFTHNDSAQISSTLTATQSLIPSVIKTVSLTSTLAPSDNFNIVEVTIESLSQTFTPTQSLSLQHAISLSSLLGPDQEFSISLVRPKTISSTLIPTHSLSPTLTYNLNVSSPLSFTFLIDQLRFIPQSIISTLIPSQSLNPIFNYKRSTLQPLSLSSTIDLNHYKTFSFSSSLILSQSFIFPPIAHIEQSLIDLQQSFSYSSVNQTKVIILIDEADHSFLVYQPPIILAQPRYEQLLPFNYLTIDKSLLTTQFKTLIYLTFSTIVTPNLKRYLNTTGPYQLIINNDIWSGYLKDLKDEKLRFEVEYTGREN